MHYFRGNTTTERAPRRAPTSPEGPGKTAKRGALGSPPFTGAKTGDGFRKHFRQNVTAKPTDAAKGAGPFVESPSKPRAGLKDKGQGSALEETGGSESAVERNWGAPLVGWATTVQRQSGAKVQDAGHVRSAFLGSASVNVLLR